MALEPIRPKDLPPSVTVYATDRIPSDDGVNVGGALPVQIVDAGAPVPSEATAIAGIDNVSRMTPFLTRAVLNNEIAPSVLLAQAWAESPTPPIPGSESSKTWAGQAAISAAQAALYDGPSFNTVSRLLADTTMSYANTTAGDMITTRAERLAFQVVDAATSVVDGYPMTTAGGVKVKVIGSVVSIKAFNPAGGGADDTDAIKRALRAMALGHIAGIDFEDVLCGLSQAVSITLVRNSQIIASAGGGIVALNAYTVEFLLHVYTAGFDFRQQGVLWDGANICPGLFRVVNAVNNNGHCRLINNVLRNVKRSLVKDGVGNSDAAHIRGGFQSVEITGNTVKNISRDAGAGSPGLSGTTGIAVFQDTTSGTSLYAMSLVHTKNTYDTITTDDLGSARADCDGLKFFTGEGGSSTFLPTQFYSSGNNYIDCAGRGIKGQVSHAEVHGETFTRKGVLPIFGGFSDINLQYGSGSISDIEVFYNPVGGLSPFTHDGASGAGGQVVAFYATPIAGRELGGPTVSNIRVYNNVPKAVGTLYAIGEFTNSTPDLNFSTVITMEHCKVFGGAVKYMAITPAKGASTKKTYLNLTANYAQELTNALVGGTASSEPNLTIFADRNINMSGTDVMVAELLSTPGSRVKCVVSGMNNIGVLSAPGTLNTSDVGKVAALRLNGFYPDAPVTSNVGGVNVDSVTIADDEIYMFRKMGINNYGAYMVSVNSGRTAQAFFGIDVAAVNDMSGGTSSAFVFGAGVNPDTDGKVNVWHDGTNLWIKNRLGSTRTFTVLCVG